MMGRDGSGNVLAPNLTLKLDVLLQNFPPNRRQDEQTQVMFLILRNISNLRRVYHSYCTLGHNRVQSSKSDMTRLQFWRFIKDSHIHHYKISLPEMDRIIAPCLEKRSVHQPTERFSLSDFLTSITVLAYVIFKDRISLNNTTNGKTKNEKQRPAGAQGGRAQPQRSQSYTLSSCLQKLITDHIMVHSGRVKGGFLFDPRRCINAIAYMESSWMVYRSICDRSTREPTLVMRKLMHALNDFQIIGPRLPAEKFLQILASDHPRVYQDGGYNLEIEICFLEYFETLLACAVTFVDEDLMQQENQAPPQGSRPARRFRTGASSAGSGIGHSRPGSSYSRRTSARSSRSVSSQPSSITSIEEDESTSSSEASTLQASQGQGASHAIGESMEATMGSLEDLNINDETAGRVNDRRSTPDMSMLFGDMEDDEEVVEASPRARRRTPEVVTAEIEKREQEFSTWSTKLRIFFTRYLIPAWQRVDLLRREAARHRR